MEAAIEIKNVIKRFGTETVLNNLSFDIPRGKITTILGFSGAGKSTLMKHILGLMHPTSGSIKVLARDLSQMDDKSLREFRQNFGMVFQYAALFDSKTAFENVAFPLCEFTKYRKSKIDNIVMELLKSVGLEEKSFHKLPAKLSGGMRKRVGLARALALSPQVMLYDEPTTGLDPITTRMVNDLIRDTAEKNKSKQLTSVIISHDIKATLEISDYIAFLDRGKIVEYQPVEKFTESQNPIVRKFLDLCI